MLGAMPPTAAADRYRLGLRPGPITATGGGGRSQKPLAPDAASGNAASSCGRLWRNGTARGQATATNSRMAAGGCPWRYYSKLNFNKCISLIMVPDESLLPLV